MKTRKKQISIIGSKGIPARYGGFETLVHYIAPTLTKKYTINVACCKNTYLKNEQQKYWKNTNRFFLPLDANGFSGILFDILSFLILLRRTQVFLILGTSIGCFLPLLRLFAFRKKIIIHPDGLEWERSKWPYLVQKYLKLSSVLSYYCSDIIIIDHPELRKTIPKNQFHKITEIAYGGNHLSRDSSPPVLRQNYWLSISRAEPENKLTLIADSFISIPEQTWVLISNLNGSTYGKKLKKRYGHYRNIILIDQTYNETKLANYLNNCYGYIHGNSVGGTNPSLVNALFHCSRIICHDNLFNKHVTENKALYFSSANELTMALQFEQNKSSGTDFITIGKNNYTWEQIIAKYDRLFESL